jgi:glycosyltransferase involved in cell wall biosynthesis
MKISIIAHGAHGGSGGIDKYTSYVIDVLNNNKSINSIDVYTKTIVNFKSNKITKFQSNNNIVLISIIIWNFIRLMKSDMIIISHINLLPFALIQILLRKKIILFGYGLEIRFITKNFFYKYLIKKINFFICMREHTLKILKKKYKLKNKSYFLLDNCIKIKKLNKLHNTKQKNIITVARLWSSEKFKGVDETLEAISLLNKINFLYIVIGDGDDKKRLIDKAKKLNVIKNVRFLGKVSDKIRDNWLKKSSIMSMPGSDKIYDTYPARFAFLEAAQFGLKIIGSNPFPSEKFFEKKYKNLNFVNPKNKYQILDKILKFQKKLKNYDKKFLNDFSFENFSKNLNKILIKINSS